MANATNSVIRLARVGPEGFFVATDTEGAWRVLWSDPFETAPGGWRFGRAVDMASAKLLPPLRPGKIVGIGRNYAAHAAELGNPVPTEPVIFLKAPSAVIGPQAPVVLPPQSQRVEHEGEIAVVLGRRLRHGDRASARSAVLGYTCACDVTARDLQRRDPTFARAKSFDTFCPLGPVIGVGLDPDSLEVHTRVNGTLRQSGAVREMLVGIFDLLVYASAIMTLEPGDVVLTGSPPGVGPLAPGDRLEVEIPGIGVLSNPVEAADDGR